MNVTILGTGNMARAISKRLLAGGNSVILQSRTPETKNPVVQDLRSNAKNGATVQVARLYSPLEDSVVMSALWYPTVLEVIRTFGRELDGKTFVEISNPLNSSYDDLATPAGSSAAEETARVAPQTTKIVKAFNTTFAGPLSQGNVAGQPLDVFLAGDDKSAKEIIMKLVEEGGLHPIDAGPLKRARELEGLGLLSIAIQSQIPKPWMSGIKVLS